AGATGRTCTCRRTAAARAATRSARACPGRATRAGSAARSWSGCCGTVTGGPTASRATAALASAGGHRELDRTDKLVDAGQQRAADQEKRNGAGGDRLT